MINRRQFLKLSLALGSSALLPPLHSTRVLADSSTRWFMPDESAPHQRTWMAFIASRNIWTHSKIPHLQRNLIDIARTIAKYEPVSILVRPQDRSRAIELLQGLDQHPYPIRLHDTELNDFWIRDTGPIYVNNHQGQQAAIDFNFNGWGDKQSFYHDAKVASFVAQRSNTTLLTSTLTLEGGCFEVDGHGTAIMTESCILNKNRNPGRTKAEVEIELKHLLGLDKVIWLKGIKGKDITDSHTDFYARFVKPDTVLVHRTINRSYYDYELSRENIAILEASTNAQGQALKVIPLDPPSTFNTEFGSYSFAAGYIGYYLCNGAVLMQKFGDQRADEHAKKVLQQLFPQHQIEQLAVDALASGGGTLHCATQQQPV